MERFGLFAITYSLPMFTDNQMVNYNICSLKTTQL